MKKIKNTILMITILMSANLWGCGKNLRQQKLPQNQSKESVSKGKLWITQNNYTRSIDVDDHEMVFSDSTQLRFKPAQSDFELQINNKTETVPISGVRFYFAPEKIKLNLVENYSEPQKENLIFLGQFELNGGNETLKLISKNPIPAQLMKKEISHEEQNGTVTPKERTYSEQSNSTLEFIPNSDGTKVGVYIKPVLEEKMLFKYSSIILQDKKLPVGRKKVCQIFHIPPIEKQPPNGSFPFCNLEQDAYCDIYSEVCNMTCYGTPRTPKMRELYEMKFIPCYKELEIPYEYQVFEDTVETIGVKIKFDSVQNSLFAIPKKATDFASVKNLNQKIELNRTEFLFTR